MLTHIHIKDLAIVTTLEAELGPGMTALTGETGAGKSILVDALGLVLGDRADNGMIRSGCDRAEITAVFRIAEPADANRWLEQHALDAGNECILRRVLDRKSGSRAFINGSPAPLKSLQALGAELVEIHGQHAHQSLLQREQQRRLLDDYAKQNRLCQQVADLYSSWHQAEQELASLRTASSERSERLELLHFQVAELSKLAPVAAELENLDRDQRRLSNASLLLRQCGRVLTELDESEESILMRLSQTGRELEEILSLEPSLGECREMLENAAIQIQEATSTLRNYAEGIDLNPQRLEEVEIRLGEIHDLARKYRSRPEELPARLIVMEQELEQLEHAGDHLNELESKVVQLSADYLKQASLLSKKRQQAAGRLQKAVTQGIQTLGMPQGEVRIRVERLPAEKASAHGLDRVEFQISANPGHPLQPLARVASGGELSRISLAIQVAAIDCAQVPTLIFDEVDVGIGGGVAEIVGRLLHQLGEERQVLCVTHLPQVAARGHHHLLISKHPEEKSVTTRISELEGEERIQEIARMLGGIDITAKTLSHAGEMVQGA